MRPIEQIVIGMVSATVEISVLGVIIFWRLRKEWMALDDDPEEGEAIDGPSF